MQWVATAISAGVRIDIVKPAAQTCFTSMAFGGILFEGHEPIRQAIGHTVDLADLYRLND